MSESADAGKERNRFYGEFDLHRARQLGRKRKPAIHQTQALEKLSEWSRGTGSPRGAILVLPTGGGKTFTALRYLCTGPLSDGYKVLWLAHTHHLLEQAYEACESSVGEIAEPKSTLRVRVVSGTVGHWRVGSIASEDDVVIATLQTIVQARAQRHPALEAFLEASGGKLLVVFDEAHHSPAPSYRKMVTGLRDKYPAMKLLGLTATPIYSDEKKQGWLTKLFPQGIVYQTTPGVLMASGVLAQPQFEDEKTQIVPSFDEVAFRRWKSTFQDLPEDIIDALARNRERNELIAGTYVQHREKYGKTIIFADRWFQCEHIAEALGRRGVKAGAVYSHVDRGPGTPEARNRRTKDENAKVLEQFKRGDIEVLLNVRMLTEGTDVPDVQSVFLTRQTTSRILQTQMIGRALRGPKFGGTAKAYIVSFVDDWRQLINFAEYDQLGEGQADESETEYGKRPPLKLISIDRVRSLAQQLDSGINVASRPYLSLLPIGWYRVGYDVLVEGTDDVESERALVMVFEGQEGAYEGAIVELQGARTDELADESASLEANRVLIEKVRSAHFRNVEEHGFTDLLGDLFQIARHIAQADGAAPRFFPFESRQAHDLDAVAAGHIADDLGPARVKAMLAAEYERGDRFWREVYPRFDLYKSEYDSVVNRLLEVGSGTSHAPIVSNPAALPDREPPRDRKQHVFDRDKRCLCCGSTKRLRADHVKSAYLGGGTETENLQTLCEACNGHKSTRSIDFRVTQTPHTRPPEVFPFIERDSGGDDGSAWERELRRALNFYYECASVGRVELGNARRWTVELASGNDPRWLDAHMKLWVKRIHAKQSQEDEPRVEALTVRSADGQHQATYASTRQRS